MTADVQRLVKLAETAQLFRTADGQAYASMPVKAHQENWLVRSKQFSEWLQRRNFDETGELARQQDVREATKNIESRCLFDAPTQPIFLRVAEYDGRVYLDLADDVWSVVEIDPRGWRIVTAPSIKFRRTTGTLALPAPVSGGTINDLRPLVNLSGQSDFQLAVGCAVAALRTRGPFPVLGLYGEHGTAKSTVARVVRKLVDPRHPDLRGQPKDLQDLMIAARNNWVLVFDNLSFIPAWLSDALCRLATGAGFAARRLYSDDDEVLFEARRPVILTGIGELATRSDLLDRCVNIETPLISDKERRSEADIESAFTAAHPRILGALLDGVSAGLRNLPNTNLERNPRMADFAIWISAAETGLGWGGGTFVTAYEENRAEANRIPLENSPITTPLFSLLRKGPWQGTATALLKALTQVAEEAASKTSGWPKTERALSMALRRLAPNLRSTGVAITFDRTTDRSRTRIIGIRFLASASSDASDPGQVGAEVERAGAAGSCGKALIAEAQKRLFEIADRAEADGDHKAAVAAVHEVINSTKLMSPSDSAVDGFVNAMQEITDEQLDAVQRRVASDAGQTGGSGEATPKKHD
jgi:hypothetical protein